MLPREIIHAPVSCPGATEVGFAIKCLRRGTIRKLRVLQLTGTLAGFQYCLYNTAAACPVGTGPTAGATVNEKLYRITPLLTVAAASAQYSTGLAFPEVGISDIDLAYECLDDVDGNTLVGGVASRGSNLYMKIISAGTGAKTYGVAMTIIDPNFA